MRVRVLLLLLVAGIIFPGIWSAARLGLARLREGEHALPDVTHALVCLAHKGNDRAAHKCLPRHLHVAGAGTRRRDGGEARRVAACHVAVSSRSTGASTRRFARPRSP